jgi:hypothetical protein
MRGKRFPDMKDRWKMANGRAKGLTSGQEEISMKGTLSMTNVMVKELSLAVTGNDLQVIFKMVNQSGSR